MRGASALRPLRLPFAHARARPLQSLCLLCQHRLYSARPAPSSPRGTLLHQRRSWSSSPSHYSSEQGAADTPDITNHYTIFPSTVPQGPPPNSSFNIDTAALRREFLQLQGAIHPDKFPAGAAKQRAEALSSRINDAYRTLSDPLSRAQYLLAQFHGIDVLAEDGATKYASSKALDPETLMEIMDVQETVEGLSSGVPAAEAEATVERLRAENAERIQASVQRLSDAFDSGDVETAEIETVRLRFWYSLRDGLREWEHGHGEIRIVH